MENLDFELNPFFEMTPDLVCIAGKDGFFRKVNPAVIQTLEYSESELSERLISSFIYPDDREMTEREREKLLGGEPLGERFIWWNFVSSRRDRIEQAKSDWKEGRIILPPLDNHEFIPLPEDKSRPVGSAPPPPALS